MTDAQAAFDPAADLALALRLADEADAITTARFGAIDLRVETKPDLTPVSDADTAVESMIRKILADERPGDEVLGEEEGLTETGSDRRWVLDPVDGTKNFVRGVPVWGTLLGLEVRGEIVAGVASAPALGRRWWAAQGLGAYASGPAGERRLQVSQIGRLEDAFLSFASIPAWEDEGRLDGFLELVRRVPRSRAYGDFWSHMMVAEGVVDVACEPDVSYWDMAALKIIVEEAGGTFTDLDGRARAYTGNVLTTNGKLHEDALALLQPRP